MKLSIVVYLLSSPVLVGAFQASTDPMPASSTALFGIKKKNDLTAQSPPLGRHPPRKICLMVEPTPFTHVSGYANRFKEMLKFMKKAGDDVEVLTVDSKTPAAKLPKDFKGYPIRHTQGFTFPLYNHISLSVDLPEMKGARILEEKQVDLIHVTSPGFMLFAAIFYARVMCIPLVMSYHTHLPTYGKQIMRANGTGYFQTFSPRIFFLFFRQKLPWIRSWN